MDNILSQIMQFCTDANSSSIKNYPNYFEIDTSCLYAWHNRLLQIPAKTKPDFLIFQGDGILYSGDT